MKMLLRTPAAAAANVRRLRGRAGVFFSRARTGAGQVPGPEDGESPRGRASHRVSAALGRLPRYLRH